MRCFQKEFLLLGFVSILSGCSPGKNPSPLAPDSFSKAVSLPVKTSILHFAKITRDIRMKEYFSFLDSLTSNYDTLRNPKLNEYAIVHANPWILDTLRSWDYYILKKRGKFFYDQSKMVVLHKGDKLLIPDSSSVSVIMKKIKSTVLDLNIPEYKLRLIQLGDTILNCNVRVGRNAEEYLALAGHSVNLKTPVGEGEVIRIERNPIFVNPDTGKRYDSTLRDDGRYTKFPVIPWLEPSINGIRYGDLIHPTTNVNTLSKAYSHGCIGTSEADAWTIYYNAPIGTKVIFRYNLKAIDTKGDTIILKDIYNLKESKRAI